jgi:hypothetical protein
MPDRLKNHCFKLRCDDCRPSIGRPNSVKITFPEWNNFITRFTESRILMLTEPEPHNLFLAPLVTVIASQEANEA